MAENEEPFRRGMVVMAHPDDAEWSCAGTVAKWCAEGWDVVYVLCTDGSKGSSDPEMTSEKLVKLREKEQRAAGKVLGLQDVVFLGYPDSLLEPTLELRKDIAREIRRYKPDVVIVGSSKVGSRYESGYPRKTTSFRPSTLPALRCSFSLILISFSGVISGSELPLLPSVHRT